jgi:hypothetical protein
LGTTKPPYDSWIPNFSSGRGVSKVEQLASIQLYKDVLMYNLQLAVLRAGARGLSYDLAMKPDTMSIDQVMKYLKVNGITYYNSKEYQQIGMSPSPIKEFDMSMSDSVGKYVDLLGYLDHEMDKISGVSPERQGGLQGASQGLGVTQAAVFQSNLITQPYFVGFEKFCSRVLNQQAKLVKVAWAGKEAFAPVIGTTGVDFLREHFDLDLEDFAVAVESVPPMIQDRSKFESMVMTVVQSDPTFIDEALSILLEPDIQVAVRRFQRKRALQKIYLSKQAEMQQQQQNALEAKMAEMQDQQQQRQIDADLEETQMKNETGIQKSMISGRTKLSSDRITYLREMQKLNKQNNEPKRRD